MTVVVPNVPTPVPSRADPVNFAARADAYHEALPNVVDAMNLQNAENNSLNSSTAALKAQTDAVAASVALTANVTAWNAVAVYVVGNCVFDPVDFLTYRRKTAGSSAVRPGLDATNWMLLTGFGDVTLNGTQTLTNKTLSLGSNTLSGTLSQFNSALSDADFATLAGNETLTNKTLSLGSNSLSGTLAQFNSSLSDADFATLAGNETLTNKTLTSPSLSGVTVTDGTANAITYLNGSKQLVSGSGLTFDGTNLGIGVTPTSKLDILGPGNNGGVNTDLTARVLSANSAAGLGLNFNSIWSIGTSQPLIFGTESSERMRLTSTGLGIGTTSPQTRFEANQTGVGSVVIPIVAANQDTSATGTGAGIGFVVDGVSDVIGAQVAGIRTAGAYHASALAMYTQDSGGAGLLERARIDSSGNLGLGVTPSAWAGVKALQINGLGSISADVNTIALSHNVIGNIYSGFDAAYGSTGQPAVAYSLDKSSGSFKWFTAPSGTAGQPISFTQAMTLDASGNLLVGATAALLPASGRGNITVNGATDSVLSFGIAGSTFSYIYSSPTSFELAAESARDIVFRSNGAERARIDSSGNLGLGVTPSAWQTAVRAFDIAGGSNAGALYSGAGVGLGAIANAYYLNGLFYYKTTAAASDYRQDSGTHKWFNASTGTAGNAISFTQAMTLDASGRLLVGTTSANTPAIAVFNRSNTLSSPILAWTNSANNSGYLHVLANGAGITADGYLILGSGESGTNGFTERVRIDSSGNLLVGQTGPRVQNSNSFDLDTVDGCAYVNHALGTPSGYYYACFGYSYTSIGSISQNGTTAVSYNTSSDYRLKNITGPITTSGTYIDSLNPVEGTWKSDGSTFVGLIAHEVQEVSRTQVATGQKDGEQMQAMDYSNSELIANLIAEVKSLRARVAALETN